MTVDADTAKDFVQALALPTVHLRPDILAMAVGAGKTLVAREVA